MKSTDFAQHLTAFLAEYLPAQRNVSPNTVKTYRDTFILFLRYCRDERKYAPEKLKLQQIDYVLILDFLEFLERERGCCTRTRNQRLAALRSFFRYVQTEAPEYILQCQRIFAIRSARCDRPSLCYLTSEELSAILSNVDLATKKGRRDAVLLSVLYDSGARVQELCDIQARDVHLEKPYYVKLKGKGRKKRIVPLMPSSVRILTEYMKEFNLLVPHRADTPLFTNQRGEKLTRSGIRYILLKYVDKTRTTHGGLNFPISPHSVRHSRAMHLLEANTPLVVIRDFLGHEDIGTTGIYARANIEMKRKALEKANDFSPTLPESQTIWNTDKNLLSWLEGL